MEKLNKIIISDLKYYIQTSNKTLSQFSSYLAEEILDTHDNNEIKDILNDQGFNECESIFYNLIDYIEYQHSLLK